MVWSPLPSPRRRPRLYNFQTPRRTKSFNIHCVANSAPAHSSPSHTACGRSWILTRSSSLMPGASFKLYPRVALYSCPREVFSQCFNRIRPGTCVSSGFGSPVGPHGAKTVDGTTFQRSRSQGAEKRAVCFRPSQSSEALNSLSSDKLREGERLPQAR